MEGNTKILTVVALCIQVVAGNVSADAKSEADSIALIKEYDARLVEPYMKNLETIKRLKAENEAITKGRSALGKGKSGKYVMNDAEVSESRDILRKRGFYLDINQLMREAGRLYQKGKDNPDYQPKFTKTSELILKIQSRLDSGDTDIAYEWNQAVEIYQNLSERLD